MSDKAVDLTNVALLTAGLLATAKNIKEQQGTVCPVAMMVPEGSQGEHSLLMLDFSSKEEQEMAYAFVRQHAQETNAYAVGVVNDAWVRKCPMDDLPIVDWRVLPRMEILIAAARNRAGQEMVRVVEYSRGENGKIKWEPETVYSHIEDGRIARVLRSIW